MFISDYEVHTQSPNNLKSRKSSRSSESSNNNRRVYNKREKGQRIVFIPIHLYRYVHIFYVYIVYIHMYKNKKSLKKNITLQREKFHERYAIIGMFVMVENTHAHNSWINLEGFTRRRVFCMYYYYAQLCVYICGPRI